MRVTGTSSAEDRRVFDADHAAPDHRHAARQPAELENLVAVEDARAVERHAVGPVGPRSDCNQRLVEAGLDPFAALGRDLDLMGVDEFGLAPGMLHHVAHELVLQHLDLVVERLVQPLDDVADRNVLLHAIAAAVKTTLAEACEVQHRLADRFRRDRAGMHGDAAEPPALLDHQHGFAELRRLDRRAPARGAAADHQHVVVLHLLPKLSSRQRSKKPPIACVTRFCGRLTASRAGRLDVEHAFPHLNVTSGAFPAHRGRVLR
jgi:hypothetical protein